MYHDIGSDDPSTEAWQVVRRSDFLRQLDYLRRHYDVVTMDRAMEVISSVEGPPVDRPLAVLTFDDGLRGNIEQLLPIAEREKVPVLIYLATRQIESGSSYWFDQLVNHLQSSEPIDLDLDHFKLGRHRLNDRHGAANWALIQALLVAIKARPSEDCDAIVDEVSRQVGGRQRSVLAPLTAAEVHQLAGCPWVHLGAHTHGHEVLTLLPRETARESIQRSVARIESWVGYRPQHFAYPAGFYNEEVKQLVAETGFVSAVTTEEGVWTRPRSALAIPRISVGRYDDLDRFKVNTFRYL